MMGSYDKIKIYHFSGFEIKQLQIEIKMNLKKFESLKIRNKKIKTYFGFFQWVFKGCDFDRVPWRVIPSFCLAAVNSSMKTKKISKWSFFMFFFRPIYTTIL